MNFQKVLEYFKININDINIMYISLPKSLYNRKYFASLSYYNSNFEENFNDIMKLNVPIKIDFLLNNDNEYIGDKISKDICILYNEDNTTYISYLEMNFFDDEETYDEYNKNLIKIYKLIQHI